MATAIYCGPEQQVGRWAMRSMKEHELWQELLIEASNTNDISHGKPDHCGPTRVQGIDTIQNVSFGLRRSWLGENLILSILRRLLQ